MTFSEHAKDTTDPDCKPISPRSVFAELAESDLEDAAEEEKKDTFVILRNEARHIAESGAAKQEQQLADDRFRLAFFVEESELEEGDVEEEEEEEGGEEQEAGRGSGDTKEDGEKMHARGTAEEEAKKENKPGTYTQSFRPFMWVWASDEERSSGASAYQYRTNRSRGIRLLRHGPSQASS